MSSLISWELSTLASVGGKTSLSTLSPVTTKRPCWPCPSILLSVGRCLCPAGSRSRKEQKKMRLVLGEEKIKISIELFGR